jgi:hypothetical protein
MRTIAGLLQSANKFEQVPQPDSDEHGTSDPQVKSSSPDLAIAG